MQKHNHNNNNRNYFLYTLTKNVFKKRRKKDRKWQKTKRKGMGKH